MKIGFGCSSEKEKCAFCGKTTNDYMEYSENGIYVKYWCHCECRKNLTDRLKPIMVLLKQAMEQTK